MAEKRRAHYPLAKLKETFASVSSLRMTFTASQCALELGITRAQTVAIVQAMTPRQLYESIKER